MTGPRLIPVFFVLLLAACADRERPVDPVWGKQPCAACAMLVSDPHTTAQLLTPDGDHLFFDDLGCLLTSPKYAAAASVWVRDAGGGWVDARTARYVRGPTPMDYGFLPGPDGVELASVERAIAARAGAR